MKRTRIIKIIRKLSPQEYNASIIIPLKPLYAHRATKSLKQFFNILFNSPVKLLNKKEDEILLNITTSKDLEIKRSFNILINDEVLLISDMHNINKNEDNDINSHKEKYLKDFNTLIKKFNITFKFEYIIFEYNIIINKLENN